MLFTIARFFGKFPERSEYISWNYPPEISELTTILVAHIIALWLANIVSLIIIHLRLRVVEYLAQPYCLHERHRISICLFTFSTALLLKEVERSLAVRLNFLNLTLNSMCIRPFYYSFCSKCFMVNVNLMDWHSKMKVFVQANAMLYIATSYAVCLITAHRQKLPLENACRRPPPTTKVTTEFG